MASTQATTRPANSSATINSRDKRIAQIAWRWNRQYRYDAEYKARGFTADEIRAGDELGEAMAEEYARNRRVYGDPAYGSWPADAQQPVRDKVLAMLRGETKPELSTPATSAASVVVTSLAYELTARASKSRVIAKTLHESGIRSSDVAQMGPALWKQFHAGLKSAGVLGTYSTPPSIKTIARTIVELRQLEQLIPVCGVGRIPSSSEAA